LGRLIPKGKIYYVPGNHEYYWSFDQVIPELKRLGIRVLLNQGELLSHNETPIWVGGVTDPAAESSGGEAPNVNQAAQGSESAKFKLFLSHRPDYAPLASKVGFNLQLSGHTHGGQFFPWTYVGKLFHRFYIGLMKFESMWIYVSPGTGTWGPPIRIGTTPEVTCIQLVRDPRV
jgi:predicted MPP superfamily phosphohydrolase